VPDRVKPSFVILTFEGLSVGVPVSKIINDGMLYSCTHVATVSFEGLIPPTFVQYSEVFLLIPSPPYLTGGVECCF